jgi:hypothetical protein
MSFRTRVLMLYSFYSTCFSGLSTCNRMLGIAGYMDVDNYIQMFFSNRNGLSPFEYVQ